MTKVIFSQPHEHGGCCAPWCRESVDSGGGLAGWQRDDLLLEEGAVELPEGEFNAAFNPEAVVKVTDVLLASHENTAQIIDARPAARFNAEVDEPRPGLRRGHIPGALNVPWTELVREGELKTTDELDAIFFWSRRQLRQTNYRQLRLWCNGSRGFVSTRDAGCAKRETVRRRME